MKNNNSKKKEKYLIIIGILLVSTFFIGFFIYKNSENISDNLNPINQDSIIMSDKTANIISVVPLTTKKEALNYSFTLNIQKSDKNKLESDSIALVFQLRGVDYRKIKNKVGEIEENLLDEINNQIKKLLYLK